MPRRPFADMGPGSHILTIVLIWILICISEISSSGVFELRIKSFVNDLGRDKDGNCCSGFLRASNGVCSGVCNTKFRVCVTNYQVNIAQSEVCIFGNVSSPVLGSNSFQLKDMEIGGFSNPISFPFEFGWPGTFSLIIEAWHDNDTSPLSNGNGDVLINRLQTQGSLSIGDHWTDHRNKSSLVSYEYRVRCNSYYYGNACADICRPRNDNFGHYECSETGNKTCYPGWTGEYCTRAICLPGCTYGHCDEPHTCKCNLGWEGPLCDQCIKYPGCKHGTCVEPWKCTCDEGWGGLFCNQDLNYCTNNKPCKNGATCYNTGQGSYTCECPPGYTGTDCEKRLGDCAMDRCLNGGTCGENGTSFICACPMGYHGRRCETPADTCEDQPCKNMATCINTEKGYQCRCRPGYTGTNCELEIDRCTPNPCKNGGSCVNEDNGHRCHCKVGFTGYNCEVNIDDCQVNPCLHSGTCIDLINEYKCVCVPGMAGKLCEQRVDYCLTMPCANGGQCQDLRNDFECKCRPGFTGKDCSHEEDKCAMVPCKNGGMCANRNNDFICTCMTGFYGPTCARVLNNDTLGMSNSSRQVSDMDNSALSAQHVVLIATVSTAIPLFALIAAGIVLYMKLRSRREAQRADELARKQNEQNSLSAGHLHKGFPSDHRIINALDYPKAKCVNSVDPEWTKDSLHRVKSNKQLNTDAAYISAQQQQRASMLLMPNDKLDTTKDSLCSASSLVPGNRSHMHADHRISTITIDTSQMCQSSDASLVKRLPEDLNTSCGGHSSVYVIDEHYNHSNSYPSPNCTVLPTDCLTTEDGLLATEV